MSAKTDIAGFVDARSSTSASAHRCEAVGEDAHDRSRWRCAFGCSGRDRLVAALPYPLIDENRVRASIPPGFGPEIAGTSCKQARGSQPGDGILQRLIDVSRLEAQLGQAPRGVEVHESPGQSQAGDGRPGHPARDVVGPGLADPRRRPGRPGTAPSSEAPARRSGGRGVPAGPSGSGSSSRAGTSARPPLAPSPGGGRAPRRGRR